MPDCSAIDDDDLGRLLQKLARRASVETSTGTLFVRQIGYTDARHFTFLFELTAATEEATNAKAGELAVQVLVSTSADLNNREELPREVFNRLTDRDRELLVDAIAKTSKLGERPCGDPWQTLGAMLRPKIAVLRDTVGAMSADVDPELTSDHTAIQAAIRQASENQQVFAAAAAAGAEAQRLVEEVTSSRVEPVVPHIGSTQSNGPLVSLGDAIRAMKFRWHEREHQRNLVKELGRSIQEGMASSQLPAMLSSDTGRAAQATEKSAEELAAIKDEISDLARAVAQEAIPRFLEKLGDDRESEARAFDQACKNLQWTKWACVASVVASVVVSVGMTAWQVWLSREYKLENDRQQRTTEALLSEQLTVTRALAERLVPPEPHVAVQRAATGASGVSKER